ncbi:MAG: ribosome biogenesis/translation initiation ATPase RLI [Candidatus Pacearchaeota archaeon]
MKKIAIVDKDKCKPSACSKECEKFCPVNRKGEKCVEILSKCKINEDLCIGCAICAKRCPLSALEIINLPFADENKLVHRYGENGFALYGLPHPKEGNIVGFLGRNGIGKTTAIKILSGQEKPNFGKKEIDENDIKNFFKGSELLSYFETLTKKSISYKPQNLSFLYVDVGVKDFLLKRGNEEKILELAKKINAESILSKRLNTLSGGELQKVAILAASLKESDIYFFDEPLAYLDIEERIKISKFIEDITKGKTTFIVEHDLLILDYLSDYLHIFFGQKGCFGLVSGIKSTSYAINSYLDGYLKEENIRIREKPINFNFTKNCLVSGDVFSKWPSFKKTYEGFNFECSQGEIRTGHIYGILGKNGTGKTTFMKCLAGLEEVEIGGKKEIINLSLKVSYKPQYVSSDSEELVRDIVIKEKIDKKICSHFGIENFYQKKVKNLSGGELQVLAIVRCLSKEADIYLLDEPSAYLDVEERVYLAKLIKDFIIEKGKTAFVIDHDLLLISYIADSIIYFSGERGKYGKLEGIFEFEKGIVKLLQDLDITLRKDKESGRPRINKRDSVLDREQKERGEWAIF